MQETRNPDDTKEPTITHDEILMLRDTHFNSGNVCIVTGAGTGIGRATAVAAATNQLMVVGLDINDEEGHKTQKLARDMGGQNDFLAMRSNTGHGHRTGCFGSGQDRYR